jgi:hypothetical protein
MIMRKAVGRVTSRLETLETRDLLSRLPVLTMAEYRAAVAEIREVTGTLAETGDLGEARADLGEVAAEIPFGRRQLLPKWRGELRTYDRRVAGAGLALQGQLLQDLDHAIRDGVAAGLFEVAGPGSAAFRPGSVASVASVTVVNNTGLNITVAASLNGTSQSITRPIGVRGSAPFDFGSNSPNFITVEVRRSDGLPPPPSSTRVLDRPVGGYNGKSFTVSVFAGRFSFSS